jgi:hypothetical protein
MSRLDGAQSSSRRAKKTDTSTNGISWVLGASAPWGGTASALWPLCDRLRSLQSPAQGGRSPRLPRFGGPAFVDARLVAPQRLAAVMLVAASGLPRCGAHRRWASPDRIRRLPSPLPPAPGGQALQPTPTDCDSIAIAMRFTNIRKTGLIPIAIGARQQLPSCPPDKSDPEG